MDNSRHMKPFEQSKQKGKRLQFENHVE